MNFLDGADSFDRRGRGLRRHTKKERGEGNRDAKKEKGKEDEFSG